MSPCFMFPDFLTFALTGKMKLSVLLSGNTDVFHLHLPMVTFTGMDPHPRRGCLNEAVSFFAVTFGSVKKCHAALSPE